MDESLSCNNVWTKLTDLAADNVARTHPNWVIKYGKQYYLNPGLPEVQDYLVEVVRELVANYDIDAVHMDDYFYPYKVANEVFPDQAAFKNYGASFKRWRIGDEIMSTVL